MRKPLLVLWLTAVTAVSGFVGAAVVKFFLRDAADRARAEELAREQVQKEYPNATVTAVTVQWQRETGDVREYTAVLSTYQGGKAQESGFTCVARHPHFLRWWEPAKYQLSRAE